MGWTDQHYLVFGQPPNSNRSTPVLDPLRMNPVRAIPLQSCSCDSSGVYCGALSA
jgi:hypothetical protein